MIVLVADDDPTTCALVATILQRAGHTSIIAQDAMQVMQLAKKHQPDAIVLDVQMPAGTGAGALEWLKQSTQTSQVPVVVLSGVHEPATVQQLLELGAVAYLHKPVDPESLLAALERATGTTPPAPGADRGTDAPPRTRQE